MCNVLEIVLINLKIKVKSISTVALVSLFIENHVSSIMYVKLAIFNFSDKKLINSSAFHTMHLFVSFQGWDEKFDSSYLSVKYEATASSWLVNLWMKT